MTRCFTASLVAAVLGLASLAPVAKAIANDAIDPVTTGAISPAALIAASDDRGSIGFRTALNELVTGDPLVAFAVAASLSNAVERNAIQWAAVQLNSGKVSYQAIEKLAADAPNFAPASFYRTRIEQSLIRVEPSEQQVIAALGKAEATTLDGQILLATALLHQGDREGAKQLAATLWTTNFLTEEQESTVIAQLGTLLSRQEHWQRAQYLMMHDRARASERLLDYLSDAQKSLVVARAAVSRNDVDAKALLDKVDASLHGNAIYVFSRAQRARQFELWDSAVAWLAKAPAELPESAEWWYERRLLIRKLLDAGQPDLAYQAAAGYTKGPEGRLVDSHFHAGWIALSFVGDADKARAQFIEMSKHTTLPDTVSQANYWLARAELKLGNDAAAEAALSTAARFSTAYYGLLARAELHEEPLEIRPLPSTQDTLSVFADNPVVRAIRLFAANGQNRLAVPLLRNFSAELKTAGDFVLAADLAREIGAPQIAVSIATTADQRGIPLDSLNFPADALPDSASLASERAAVFAVVRQESMFQLDAVSPAGARGLMQLMPGTAEEVAKAVGVDYSPARLVSDASYNALLGSTYLGTQLDRYDGSLLLAAAAYNAGPGNANKWIQAYGDPRASNVDPVIWVELIPFAETRTYVKRVLGNYLVYRARLGESPVTLQQALRSIR